MGTQEILWIVLLVAVIVLVIALIVLVLKAMHVLKSVNSVIKETQNSVSVITKDVDNLTVEVEALLNKTNHLLNDVNGKLQKTDPVFVALGELGVTVSSVNQSATNFSKAFIVKQKRAGSSFMKMSGAAAQTIKELLKKNKETTIKKF